MEHGRGKASSDIGFPPPLLGALAGRSAADSLGRLTLYNTDACNTTPTCKTTRRSQLSGAPASQEVALTGLNLLRLLVQNRIAEFHTELELIPPEVGWLRPLRSCMPP